MITGKWFMKNIKNKHDLKHFLKHKIISEKEIEELENKAKKYPKTHSEMTKHNITIADTLYITYKNVIRRINKLKSDKTMKKEPSLTLIHKKNNWSSK